MSRGKFWVSRFRCFALARWSVVGSQVLNVKVGVGDWSAPPSPLGQPVNRKANSLPPAEAGFANWRDRPETPAEAGGYGSQNRDTFDSVQTVSDCGGPGGDSRGHRARSSGKQPMKRSAVIAHDVPANNR
jgi:hypothetical protein